MKTIKQISLTSALCLLGTLALQPPAEAALISVVPSTTTASVGSTVAVDIVASDFVDLYGWQFSATFDPAVLAATAVSEGSFLGSAGSTFFVPGMIDNASGSIAFNADTLLGPGPGASGGGVLTTLSFTVIGEGLSTLLLSDLLFLNSSFGDIDVVVNPGSITGVPASTNVPEPGALSLMLAAAAVMFHARRRKPTTPTLV